VVRIRKVVHHRPLHLRSSAAEILLVFERYLEEIQLLEGG